MRSPEKMSQEEWHRYNAMIDELFADLITSHPVPPPPPRVVVGSWLQYPVAKTFWTAFSIGARRLRVGVGNGMGPRRAARAMAA